MLRSAALMFALVALASTAFAQTAPKPDGQWRGSLGAGLSAASGNTDSTTWNVTGDAVKQTRYDKLSGYIQSVYGRRDAGGTTQRTAELYRGGGKYERDLNDRYFGFGALDLERNGLIDLDLRTVVAGGLGYHLVRGEGFTFDVSTGPSYNREIYATETRDAVEWLFAEESTHALGSTVSFRQRLVYYPSLSDSGEYRLVFDAGLVFKITNRWNATMTLSNRYQSNPRPGVENNDLLFVTGFQYVFNP